MKGEEQIFLEFNDKLHNEIYIEAKEFIKSKVKFYFKIIDACMTDSYFASKDDFINLYIYGKTLDWEHNGTGIKKTLSDILTSYYLMYNELTKGVQNKKFSLELFFTYLQDLLIKIIDYLKNIIKKYDEDFCIPGQTDENFSIVVGDYKACYYNELEELIKELKKDLEKGILVIHSIIENCSKQLTPHLLDNHAIASQNIINQLTIFSCIDILKVDDDILSILNDLINLNLIPQNVKTVTIINFILLVSAKENVWNKQSRTFLAHIFFIFRKFCYYKNLSKRINKEFNEQILDYRFEDKNVKVKNINAVELLRLMRAIENLPYIDHHNDSVYPILSQGFPQKNKDANYLSNTYTKAVDLFGTYNCFELQKFTEWLLNKV